MLFKGTRADDNKEIIGTGFYKGVQTTEPMSLGECKNLNIIIKDGDMFHVKGDIKVSFNEGKSWFTKTEVCDMEHYAHRTNGLWATDKPNLLTGEQKEKIFFKLECEAFEDYDICLDCVENREECFLAKGFKNVKYCVKFKHK